MNTHDWLLANIAADCDREGLIRIADILSVGHQMGRITTKEYWELARFVGRSLAQVDQNFWRDLTNDR